MQERIAYLYGQQAVIEGVAAEDICEKAGNYDFEAIIVDRPGGMFAA